MKTGTKKLICLLALLAVTICVFTGCGKDFSKRTVTRFDETFSWDMTPEDAKKYIESHKISNDEIKVNQFDHFTVVTDQYYTFRFDSQGKMTIAKISMGTSSDALDLVVSWYGEWDKHEKEKGSFEKYEWYATMADRNVTITLYQPGGEYYLEYHPE